MSWYVWAFAGQVVGGLLAGGLCLLAWRIGLLNDATDPGWAALGGILLGVVCVCGGQVVGGLYGQHREVKRDGF